MGKRAPTDEAHDPHRPARVLDCRGLYCPLPVLRTERALAGLAAGEILEVVATDPASSLDMAVFSQRSGHELLRRDRREGELVFYFRRAAGPPDPA